jgi:hypothetical protein
MSFASVPDQDPRDDLAFLRLHIEACWGPHPPALVPGEQTLLPGGTEPPWKVYLADTTPGRVVLWRPDVAVERRETLLVRATASLACPPDSALDPDVRREVVLRLAASPPDNIVPRDATIRRLTAADAPLFAAFDPDDPPYYVRAEIAPVLGVMVDGRLVSVAHSSRRTARACELGLETRPEVRRRGYGLAVTARWSMAVQAEGLVPIYSALAANTASLALARAAGYLRVAHAAYITA